MTAPAARVRSQALEQRCQTVTGATPGPLRVMLLASAADFEAYYEDVLGLDRERFLQSYRNDWVWLYCRVLLRAGIEPVVGIRSFSYGGTYQTQDGVTVQFLPVLSAWAAWRRYRRASAQGAASPRETPQPDAGTARPPHKSPTLSYRPHLNALRRYISEVVSALGSVKSFRSAPDLDVLYVQEYWTGQFDVMALTSRVPVVAADHGGKPEGKVKLLKRLAFRRATWVTCQTRAEVSITRSYGARAELLPNPVDTDFYCPDPEGSPRDKPRRLLVVARLTDEQKRISDIVRSLSYLPPWELDIAGSGPDLALLEGLAADLGVRHRVHFLGFVSDPSRLRQLYRSCGVFVLASAHEARVLVILEALASGCAVVASDLPVFAELVQEHGEVLVRFPVGDPRALAHAVEDAYAKRELLSQMGRSVAVAHLGLGPFEKRLVALLNEAAKTRRQQRRPHERQT
jgi:glycosyltransferase involved in cell wall biosynthesis